MKASGAKIGNRRIAAPADGRGSGRPLFRPQRPHRLHASRPAGRQPHRDERDGGHQNRCREERHRIVRSAGERGRVDPGRRASAVEQRIEERDAALRRSVDRIRERDLCGDDIARLEARIRSEQMRERANHEAEAEQEDQRERDLESASGAQQAAAVHGGPAPPLAKLRVRIDAACAPGGNSAGCGGREQRRERGQAENRAIERQVVQIHLAGGAPALDQAECQPGQREAERAAEKREQGALYQNRPDDARRGAYELQARDVGRGEQQNEADRGEQDAEHIAQRAGQVLDERPSTKGADESVFKSSA